MPEIKKNVKPVLLTYECDVCHLGNMVYSGQTIPPKGEGQKPLYVHICNKCGEGKGLQNGYPRIDHVNLDEVVTDGPTIMLPEGAKKQ